MKSPRSIMAQLSMLTANRIALTASAACLLVFVCTNSVTKVEVESLLSTFLRNATSGSSSSMLLITKQQALSRHATLVLQLQRSSNADSDDHVSTGWQTAHVFIHSDNINKACADDPHFGIRLVGSKASVVPIRLIQQSPHQWTGNFHLSLDGDYRVDAQWWGCGFSPERQQPKGHEDGTAAARIEFKVVGPWKFVPQTIASLNKHDPPSIGEGAKFASSAVWMSTSIILSTFVKPSETIPQSETYLRVDASQYPEYLWADPTRFDLQSLDPARDDLMVLLQDGSEEHIETIISRYGTLTNEHKTYLFNRVGNYEIVCFFGSRSAEDIHRLFLKELRLGSVVGGVRPFKFHYYNVTNLRHPDENWGEDNRRRCRKCKHIFLSVDELNVNMSQVEFRKQYANFIRHLQKLMDDATFPIWLLTNNAPANDNCRAPYVVDAPRTTDHPCNDVIRDLVERGDTFENRVLLMDNTDLSLLPFSMGDDSAKIRTQILANIALRIFVLVGKGVTDWRARGQRAWADGLYRNGTLAIPTANDLQPYNWNQSV